MSDTISRLNAALEGRYAIERELGAGGMATVYLAEDLRHHRKVALNMLRPELGAALGALREIGSTPRRMLRWIARFAAFAILRCRDLPGSIDRTTDRTRDREPAMDRRPLDRRSRTDWMRPPATP